jgi:hypothetical protein
MRKMSAYAKKRQAAAQHPLLDKASRVAAMLTVFRMSRSYAEGEPMPGDVEGAPDFMDTARTAQLQIRECLEGLLKCQEPADPSLDFTRLKHCLAVTTIRTLQVIYGGWRREPVRTVDLAELTETQRVVIHTLHDANQALNRAYDRWTEGKGYGLDGAGRTTLLEAVDLFADILVNSSPEQMRHAHHEALKLQRIEVV